MCTHDGGPLVEGEVVNECQVQCPRHGARFDIRTGAAVSFPAFTPTNVFEVNVTTWIDDRVLTIFLKESTCGLTLMTGVLIVSWLHESSD
jgi:Rieske Fe-S protein